MRVTNDFMAVPEGDHFVVFIHGEEYCRCDTLKEVEEEITEYLDTHPDPESPYVV